MINRENRDRWSKSKRELNPSHPISHPWPPVINGNEAFFFFNQVIYLGYFPRLSKCTSYFEETRFLLDQKPDFTLHTTHSVSKVTMCSVSGASGLCSIINSFFSHHYSQTWTIFYLYPHLFSINVDVSIISIVSDLPFHWVILFEVHFHREWKIHQCCWELTVASQMEVQIIHLHLCRLLKFIVSP